MTGAKQIKFVPNHSDLGRMIEMFLELNRVGFAGMSNKGTLFIIVPENTHLPEVINNSAAKLGYEVVA